MKGVAADQKHVQTLGPLQRQLRELGWSDDDLAAVERAWDLAARLFAVNFQSSGRPFVCHLVGTAGFVAAYGGSRAAVLAALLHAAYATGDFGVRVPGAGPRRRRRVAEAIGAGAEAIVFRFYELRAEFDTRWDAYLEKRDAARLPSVDRDALLLRACNDLDDVTDYPFSHAARRARIARLCQGSIAIADALGEAELAAALRAAWARCESLDVLPLALRDRHPTGYVAVPPAFRKRLVAGALEWAHRLWTKRTLRP